MQCWLVSFAPCLRNGGRGPAAEGLLTVESVRPTQHEVGANGSNAMILYTNPDGARLAHGPYVGGRSLSPGLCLELGDYAVQVLEVGRCRLTPG